MAWPSCRTDNLEEVLRKGYANDCCQDTSTQMRKNLGSRVALLPGKFLQIRKAFVTSSLLAEDFTDNLENVRMLYKVFNKYAKCPDELESVWMI